ncbi:MAG TPA: wax ester/triacylglycerol synthase domain-containing protein, partial [Acidimicrobiales bacterium]|nr:wax ester/triacylglycerol synthase domain-containing protein [Acidimicrobiales bacterium]
MSDELDFQPRMSDADKLMWTIERDPLLRSTITSVVVLDQAPDHTRLKEKVDRASRTVVRLRQRVVSNALSFSPPRWEVDPNFDLDYHLRFVNAANGGSMRELFDIAEPIAMQAFDRARPLWEFTVVEGLEEGRAGLIMKVHHAITDGVGGVKLMLETFDAEADPGDLGPMPDAPPVHVMNQVERFFDALGHEQRRVAGVAKRSLGMLSGAALETAADPVGVGMKVTDTVSSAARLLAPATEPLSPLMTKRSLSVQFHTLTVPLADMKAAGRRAGGKLNDAFVAGIAGGW